MTAPIRCPEFQPRTHGTCCRACGEPIGAHVRAAPDRLPNTVWPAEGEAFQEVAQRLPDGREVRHLSCIAPDPETPEDARLWAWRWVEHAADEPPIHRWRMRFEANAERIFAAALMAMRARAEKAEASNRTLRESHAVALRLAQESTNAEFMRAEKAERDLGLCREALDANERAGSLLRERAEAAETALGLVREAARALLAFARDVRDNFDCDEDAHRYRTTCRACEAGKVHESAAAALATLDGAPPQPDAAQPHVAGCPHRLGESTMCECERIRCAALDGAPGLMGEVSEMATEARRMAEAVWHASDAARWEAVVLRVLTLYTKPDRGTLINKAASLGAAAFKAREAAERMPCRTPDEVAARGRAFIEAGRAERRADEAWAQVRQMSEQAAGEQKP